MTLKKVVLPAPLGPISAVIERSRTDSVARSTARIPPKRLTTPSASKIGGPAAAAPLGSITEDHLLTLAEDSLGAEGHQPDQDQPDDDEAQRGDPRLGQRQVDEPQPFENEPEDHRTEGDAPIAG